MKLFLAGIVEHHANLIRPDWLYSSRDWRYQLGALVLILLASMINFEVRDWQWENWKAQPEQHFLDSTPMVSTTDAAFFLSYAREYQQGEPSGSFEQTRLYPDHTDAYKSATDPEFERNDTQPSAATDIPLLSVMIAQLANIFTDGNLVLAGNLMLPFTVFLTALSIGAMFWIAGYPAEGAIAAVGSGMGAGFLARTSIGRIDTDQLFLFFTAVCISLVLLASRQQSVPRLLGYVLLTALLSSISHWWHTSGFFLVVVSVVLAMGIYLSQRNLKMSCMALAVFVVAVNPLTYFDAAARFAERVFGVFSGLAIRGNPPPPGEGVTFPDTFSTVTELAGSDLLGILDLMTPHPVFGLLGLVGFIAWSILYPKKALVFLPIFMLGMMSFVLGKRFAFFAAPFVWFGFVWMLLCSTRWIATILARRHSTADSFFVDGTVLALSAVGILGISALSFESYTPRPLFSVPLTNTFGEIGTVAGDRGGVIATWWDYGYYSHFHSGLNTFHDPGAQTSPRTHLFARGLVSPVQGELIQITKFVTSQGTKGIEDHAKSLDALNTAIAAAPMPDMPIYLVLTYQFGDWMPTIAGLGRFDVEAGQPLDEEHPGQFTTTTLRCRPEGNTRLQCDDGLLNIEHGTINGKPAFGNVVVIRDGFLLRAERKNNNSPWILVLQQISSANRTYFATMHETNWNSSFNQLFHQGRYDPQRLELVLDNYPVARVYRVIQ